MADLSAHTVSAQDVMERHERPRVCVGPCGRTLDPAEAFFGFARADGPMGYWCVPCHDEQAASDTGGKRGWPLRKTDEYDLVQQRDYRCLGQKQAGGQTRTCGHRLLTGIAIIGRIKCPRCHWINHFEMSQFAREGGTV